MDYSTDTPFINYQDIKNAYDNNQIRFSFNRKIAFDLSLTEHKWGGIATLLVPITSIVSMFIVCLFVDASKWIVLFGLLSLLVYSLIPHLKWMFWFLALVLIVLPLIFLPNFMWMLVIGVGIIGMMLGYGVWWTIISLSATRAILNDEAIFEEAWRMRGVAIEDNTSNRNLYFFECNKFSGLDHTQQLK